MSKCLDQGHRPAASASAFVDRSLFAIVASHYEEERVMMEREKNSTPTEQERKQSLNKQLDKKEIARIYDGYWVLMRKNIVFAYAKKRSDVLSKIPKGKGEKSIAVKRFNSSPRHCAILFAIKGGKVMTKKMVKKVPQEKRESYNALCKRFRHKGVWVVFNIVDFERDDHFKTVIFKGSRKTKKAAWALYNRVSNTTKLTTSTPEYFPTKEEEQREYILAAETRREGGRRKGGTALECLGNMPGHMTAGKKPLTEKGAKTILDVIKSIGRERKTRG